MEAPDRPPGQRREKERRAGQDEARADRVGHQERAIRVEEAARRPVRTKLGAVEPGRVDAVEVRQDPRHAEQHDSQVLRDVADVSYGPVRVVVEGPGRDLVVVEVVVGRVEEMAARGVGDDEQRHQRNRRAGPCQQRAPHPRAAAPDEHQEREAHQDREPGRHGQSEEDPGCDLERLRRRQRRRERLERSIGPAAPPSTEPPQHGYDRHQAEVEHDDGHPVDLPGEEQERQSGDDSEGDHERCQRPRPPGYDHRQDRRDQAEDDADRGHRGRGGAGAGQDEHGFAHYAEAGQERERPPAARPFEALDRPVEIAQRLGLGGVAVGA